MRKRFSMQTGLLSGLLLAFAVISTAKSQLQSDRVYQLIAPLPEVLLSNSGNAVESSDAWEQYLSFANLHL